MALLFFDGFEEATTPGKWSSLNFTPATSDGRHGYGVRLNNSSTTAATRSIPASATTVVGFAFKQNHLSTGENAYGIPGMLGDGGATLHFQMRPLFTDGSWRFYRGTTLLGTSVGGLMNRFEWNYLEAKVTIHDSTGTIVVRHNGVEIFNFTGDTRNGGTDPTIDMVRFGSNSGYNCDIDDVYILDGTGAAPLNDFLGDVKVVPLMPTADSTPLQWTPSTGSNHFAVVDESPGNTTDYVSNSVDGEVDMFTVGPYADTADTVYAVQLSSHTAKDDAGARSFRHRVDSDSNVETGTDKALSTSFQTWYDMFVTDPDGGGAWTVAQLNAAKFGVETRP